MAQPTGDAAQEPKKTRKPAQASSSAGGVPPIEPKPATPRTRSTAAKAESATPIPPIVDLTGQGSEAATRPDPYADPEANPYLQSSSAPQHAAPVYSGQPYQYAAVQGQPKALAITSMVLGIVSVLCCWVGIVAIGAIVTGHIAQRTQPYARGFWLTGLITGYVGLGFSVLYLIFVVVSSIAGSSYDYSY